MLAVMKIEEEEEEGIWSQVGSLRELPLYMLMVKASPGGAVDRPCRDTERYVFPRVGV